MTLVKGVSTAEHEDGFIRTSCATLFNQGLIDYYNEKKLESVHADLASVDRQPNKTQLAIGAVLAELAAQEKRKRVDEAFKRLVVTMPSGMGKSRVILHAVDMVPYKQFQVTYSSQELRAAEKPALDGLALLLKESGVTITSVVATEQADVECDPTVCQVVDECDHVLIDLRLRPRAGLVIGLTATPLVSMQSNEKILVSAIHRLLSP